MLIDSMTEIRVESLVTCNVVCEEQWDQSRLIETLIYKVYKDANVYEGQNCNKTHFQV